MTKYVALIGGVSGAVGTALARELSSRKEWKVYGFSRRKPKNKFRGVRYLQLDLNDYDKCIQELSKLDDVTHLFYCGRATHGEQILESPKENLSILENFLNSIEDTAKDLQHIHLVQGGKYYGVHIGEFKNPALEEDLRAPIPNFNYDQQDLLVERSAKKNGLGQLHVQIRYFIFPLILQET